MKTRWMLSLLWLHALACSAAATDTTMLFGARPGVAMAEPATLLARAKAATGGSAWDALRSQHTMVKVVSGAEQGEAERWASITTGRSYMRVRIGSTDAIMGYDGIVAWAADASGHVGVQRDASMMELIVNAAYRDRLAFWFPERQAARIEYARQDSAGKLTYDVLRIVPEGGRPYELWINTETHMIERLREREEQSVRTEVYSDFRVVQGVRVPFTVIVSHGDEPADERYTVDTMEYNVSLDRIDFAPPIEKPRR